VNKTKSGLSLSDVHVDAGKDVEVKTASGHDMEFGLSWDFYPGMTKVDLDCSALMFDWAGVLTDACFFNQLTCCDGAVKHSGDSPDGENDGFDETIHLDLDAIPPSVSFVAFVVNAYKGGTFETVESAYAVVSEVQPTGTPNKALADCAVGCGQKNTGVVLAVIYKVGSRATRASEWRSERRSEGGSEVGSERRRKWCDWQPNETTFRLCSL
jgi:stress response protein SCP2